MQIIIRSMIEHIKNIIVVSGAVRLPIFFRFFSSSSSFFLLMLLLLSCFVLFSSSPLFFFFQVFVSTRLLAFTRVCVCGGGGGCGCVDFLLFSSGFSRPHDSRPFCKRSDQRETRKIFRKKKKTRSTKWAGAKRRTKKTRTNEKEKHPNKKAKIIVVLRSV